MTGAVVAGSAASRVDAHTPGDGEMSAVRLQEVRYQRVQEAENDGREEEEVEGEVTVHLYSHSSRPVAHAHCRDASLRICSSLLLLAVAIGFVLYELEYGALAAHSAQPSFYGHKGAPWNISNLESSIVTINHNSHHDHSEELDHQHGDGEHSHSAGTYDLAAAVTDSGQGLIGHVEIPAFSCAWLTTPLSYEDYTRGLAVFNGGMCGAPEARSPQRYCTFLYL
ncbi:uncharacterized protein [Dendrobates tinctorius]|uniref:uncharacterized protein n=1 Tax=Dendrobates tinctorius TaxID=92724 RepID=UPI003CCA4012